MGKKEVERIEEDEARIERNHARDYRAERPNSIYISSDIMEAAQIWIPPFLPRTINFVVANNPSITADANHAIRSLRLMVFAFHAIPPPSFPFRRQATAIH